MNADIVAVMQQAEARWGIRLKRKTAKEACGPCPFCHTATRDGFLVFADGGYWCRKCDAKGWVDENEPLSPAEQRLRRLELEQHRAEIERREMERRLSALEQMHQCTDHLAYHRNLDHHPEAVNYWLSEGVHAATIARYKLGYCPSCPTAPGHASYTIPVMAQGKLYNIRHRLAAPTGGGKYRPHMAGLPAMIFNADDLLANADSILLLEGEKKSLVVGQETGLPNVAIMGMQSFKPRWASKLARFKTVYVCYDPDAIDKAAETAALFKGRGRVVDLPVKADDFFVRFGACADDFMLYLERAKAVA